MSSVFGHSVDLGLVIKLINSDENLCCAHTPHLPFSKTVHWAHVMFLKQGDMKGYVSIVLEWEMHVSHFIGSRIRGWGGGGTQDTCNNVSGQRGPEPYFSLKCKSMTVVLEKWVHGPCEWKFSKKDMNVVHWHFTKKCAWTFNNEMKGMGINICTMCIVISNSDEVYLGRITLWGSGLALCININLQWTFCV